MKREIIAAILCFAASASVQAQPSGMKGMEGQAD